MILRTIVLSLGLASLQLVVFSQGVLDPQEKPKPKQEHVRYADLMWSKRVWRRIDLRQKMNQRIYFPESPSNGRLSFFDNIKNAVLSGQLTAFNPGALGDDDMLMDPFSLSELDTLLNPVSYVKTVDPITYLDTLLPVLDPVSTKDVILYEMKEDWYFDKERSVMEVRVIGICPIVAVTDEETGEFRGFKRLFWIDYSELDDFMANWTVFNARNSQEILSYSDLFRKRMFDSIIIKESNVYERYINQYAIGIEALHESDRIEQEILEMEHDLWSY